MAFIVSWFSLWLALCSASYFFMIVLFAVNLIRGQKQLPVSHAASIIPIILSFSGMAFLYLLLIAHTGVT